jgi:hypothetical protein
MLIHIRAEIEKTIKIENIRENKGKNNLEE